jgi:hypothetical protein
VALTENFCACTEFGLLLKYIRTNIRHILSDWYYSKLRWYRKLRLLEWQQWRILIRRLGPAEWHGAALCIRPLDLTSTSGFATDWQIGNNNLEESGVVLFKIEEIGSSSFLWNAGVHARTHTHTHCMRCHIPEGTFGDVYLCENWKKWLLKLFRKS